jgi:hypothetical protein
VLQRKLEQEVDDVLGAQRARLEALRASSAERRDRGTSSGVPDFATPHSTRAGTFRKYSVW